MNLDLLLKRDISRLKVELWRGLHQGQRSLPREAGRDYRCVWAYHGISALMIQMVVSVDYVQHRKLRNFSDFSQKFAALGGVNPSVDDENPFAPHKECRVGAAIVVRDVSVQVGSDHGNLRHCPRTRRQEQYHQDPPDLTERWLVAMCRCSQCCSSTYSRQLAANRWKLNCAANLI